MAELTPIPAAQRPSDPAYQPVSGYAVAAAIVSGAFALAMVALVGYGVWSRRTPLSYELLTLPIAGLVLAIVGASHIRNSEGTRTGLKVTGMSWWVCVLGGAGFGAFLFANDLALSRESQRVADAFLETLRNGKEHEAFELYVLPPELRGKADTNAPDYETVYFSAGYQGFARNEAVHVLRINGQDVTIEHVGTKEIKQEADGFRAVHVYRLIFPEGAFTFRIKLVAKEGRGGKPQWHVLLSNMEGFGVTSPTWDFFSQYGRLEMELVQEADDVAQRWMASLNSHRYGVAHAMTLPPDQRQNADLQISQLSMLGGALAMAAPVAADAPVGPAEVERLLKAGFFQKDKTGEPFPADHLDKLRKFWADPSIGPASPGRRNPGAREPGPAEKAEFVLKPDALTVGIQADVLFDPLGRQFAQATVGVVCTNPAALAEIQAARQRAASAKDDGTLTAKGLPPRDWRVVWLRTDLEPPIPAEMGGQPGGPPGGAGGPGGRPR